MLENKLTFFSRTGFLFFMADFLRPYENRKKISRQGTKENETGPGPKR